MTAVKERPSAHDELRTAERRNRSLTIAVVVLAILLVGGAAWVIYDEVTPVADAEVMEVIDSYLATWETQDEEAIRGLVTADFVINEYIYIENVDTGAVELYEWVNDDIDGVVAIGFMFDWTNERLGEPQMSGDGPWYVWFGETWAQGNATYDGVANYVVVDDGGTLRISNHFWSGVVTYGDLFD